MDLDGIEQLIEVLEGSKVEELSVRKGEAAVRIRKGRRPKVRAAAPLPTVEMPVETTGQEQAVEEQGHWVLAPMVGIFHVAEEVAQIGARVSTGQVVGAIESMKLLNDIVADTSGVVVELMVEDGLPVEYGQPLFRLETGESR